MANADAPVWVFSRLCGSANPKNDLTTLQKPKSDDAPRQICFGVSFVLARRWLSVLFHEREVISIDGNEKITRNMPLSTMIIFELRENYGPGNSVLRAEEAEEALSPLSKVYSISINCF